MSIMERQQLIQNTVFGDNFKNIVENVENDLTHLTIYDFFSEHTFRLKYTNYLNNELVFDLIKDSTTCFKLKVIPYRNEPNFTDYLNTKNVTNHQSVICKRLNQFVLSEQTPHINLFICKYYTELEQFTKLDEINVVSKDDERYKIFKNDYNKGKMKSNALLMVFENCNRENLLDFIIKFYTKFSALHWKVIFFQVLSTLAMIQSKYPSFRHNNFKSNEVFVNAVDSLDNTHSYTVQGSVYKVPNVGYQIRIDNLDWSNIEGIAENPKLDLEWVKKLHVKNTQNRYYDMHYFFNTLIQNGFIAGFMYNSLIPEDVKKFIKRIVPDKYRGLSKINVTNKGRLKSDDEYVLPIDVLTDDEYFAEFRE